MEDQYPSYIRFLCVFSDKQSYQQAMQKTFFARGMVIREKVRDLKDEFFAEVEIGVHGSSLYKEISASELTVKTYLLSSI
jgi:hypothetical protein